MTTKKKMASKKVAKSRKLEIKDLDSAKDPKGGLNFEEVKQTYVRPAGADDSLKFSWGMHK
jgi:hypothetical protein